MASSSPSHQPTATLVILSKVPDLVFSDDRLDCFAVYPASPPLLIGRLTVYAHAAPTPQPQPGAAASPRVLAADLSAGTLLLTSTSPARAGYTVLDAACPIIFTFVPSRSAVDPASRGVISKPGGGGGFMVVGLQLESHVGLCRGGANYLHCYSAKSNGGTGSWDAKPINNPRPRRTWAFDHVIAHDGRIWWVDTASTAALISCDPFAHRPDMAFVRLPDHVSNDEFFHVTDRSEDDTDRLHGFCRHLCSGIPLAARRRVQVVDGKFRWLQMQCPHMEGSRSRSRGRGDAPSVLVRTLEDPSAAPPQWRFADGRHCLSFADVWASNSYKATELPEEEPAVAFIHPYKPAVVYFVLRRHLFGVDMLDKEVVAFQRQEMAEPDDVSAASSLFACSFQPPALAAAAPPSQSQVLGHLQAAGEASGNGGAAKNTEDPEPQEVPSI